MSTRMNLGLALGVIALFVISGSFFIVNELERAVKVRFGEVVEADVKPGIHFKIPLIEEVKRFDGRVQVMDAQPGEFLTSEKKRMIVDSFIMWQIKDVEKFYIRTQGRLEIAQLLMSPRINGGLKDKIAARTLPEVVTDEREEIMSKLQEELDPIFHEELGIEVVDIRVKSVEFSSEVSETVYDQMRTERNRDAAEHRSQGRERAEGIRADADKQEKIILAEAYKQAEKLRGEGDAESARIYANAYNRDPKFYEFYRSLTAYRKSFSNKSDVLVIEPESEFFDYMKKAR